MDNKEEIKEGDIVTLISGGPEMTVGKIDEITSLAVCFYFPCAKAYDDSGTVCGKWFELTQNNIYLSALKLVKLKNT